MQKKTILPTFLQPLYDYYLAKVHVDMVAVERLVAHCVGRDWDNRYEEIVNEDEAYGRGWRLQDGFPAAGSLKSILVVRPAFLLGGGWWSGRIGQGDPSYRVFREGLGGWTISAREVAQFVVDAALRRWDEFENTVVNVSY